MADSGSHRTHRILVADDLMSNRMLLQACLKAAGYGVVPAEDGIQALEAFKREKFAIVLLDIEMPRMDGCEAMRKFREFESAGKISGHEPDHRTPVVAMTGYTKEEISQQYPDADFDDFIAKPVSRPELLALLKKWVSTCEESPVESSEKSHSGLIDAPMDLQKAIDEFEGDRELLMRVLSGFLSDMKNRIAILTRAFMEKDSLLVRQTAHAIRGGAANLTAHPLAKTAFNLEENADSAVLEGKNQMIEELDREFQRLRAYAESIQREGPHP